MAINIDHNNLLYPTFLEDHRVYALVENYWKRLLGRLLESKNIPFHSFYNKQYRTGQKIYDANPIFNAYFPKQHKQLRVIQFLPDNGDRPITAWLDHLDVNQLDPDLLPQPANPDKNLHPIPELVIHLALLKDTANQAELLLKKWILEDCAPEEMERIIEEEY